MPAAQRRARPWTKEEIAQLRIFTKQGLSRPQIAQKMKRTLWSVDHKAKRLKIHAVKK